MQKWPRALLVSIEIDGKKKEQYADGLDQARELAQDLMYDANLYGSAFEAKIYKQKGETRELIAMLTNDPCKS